MKHSIKTLTRTIPADLETPVGIYLKIRDLYPQSALLESSDYHTSQNSVSYIGVAPIASFKVENETITKTYPDGCVAETPIIPGVDVVKELRRYVESYHIDGDGQLNNGLFGYTAYDAVRYFEHVAIQPKEACFNGIPDMMYILYRYVIEVNHYKTR